MDYRAKIEIDVQDAFDELRRKEQEEFIKSNLSVLDIDDLIEIIEPNGYKVKKNENIRTNQEAPRNPKGTWRC